MNYPQIEGVVLKSLGSHSDDRGIFTELFRAPDFTYEFVQANHSHSRRNVLRGLHYHRNQADLWYVVSGRAQVALVDLRTHGKPAQTTLVLDSMTPASLLIPPGVAHGFLALTDVDLIYLVTRLYDPDDEHGIAWNDPNLEISWDARNPILSARDSTNPQLTWNQIPAFL
jgi:dTDP-4-dehydrorhamnose 3,5-epimerase